MERKTQKRKPHIFVLRGIGESKLLLVSGNGTETMWSDWMRTSRANQLAKRLADQLGIEVRR